MSLQVSAGYLLTFNSKAPILVSFAAHGWSFMVFKDSLSTLEKSFQESVILLSKVYLRMSY